MVSIFEPAKTKETFLKQININNLYKFKEKANKSSLVPFLSNTEKLFEKIEETPGPGQYNIQNVQDDYEHKKYLKKNIENYKDSLHDFYHLVNNFSIKANNFRTPGPGEYNPGENKNFGAKIKKNNSLRNNFLIYKNNQRIRNKTFINDLECEKNITMKIPKNPFDNNFIDNIDNKTNINFNKTKKFNSLNNNIFKKLLFTYSKFGEEGNFLANKDNEFSYSKEAAYTPFNMTNNFRISNSDLNLYTLNKSNSTNNIIESKNKKKKAKIIRTIHDHIRIKEISEQKKIEMKGYSAKSNYYLEKYLSSKLFHQIPGPGYYFPKKPHKSHLLINSKSETDIRRIKKELLSKIYKENKKPEKIELISNEQKMKKIILSKTMNELKKDIIKKGFEKVKEVYLKNKYNTIMETLIKAEQLYEKENKSKNKKEEKNNNNEEIQDTGYPIKYSKINSRKKMNNQANFISKEDRFKSPLGWENEIIKNMNPGPGQYENEYGSISNNNKNIINLSLLKNINIPKDRKLFTDEIKDTNPPVGNYQSQFFNSIEFNNLIKTNIKNIENPIKNGFKEIIKAKTQKNIENNKLNEKIANSMLGPASYFHNSGTIFNKNNNKINNISSKREIKNKGFILSKFQQKKPNNYGISKDRQEYFRWIKKSFNMSYI